MQTVTECGVNKSQQIQSNNNIKSDRTRMKPLLAIVAIGTISLLSACSPMTGDLQCSGNTGCPSPGVINRQAANGAYGQDQGSGVIANAGNRQVSVNVSDIPKPYTINAPLPGSPVRLNETTQRIWIAPWVDQNGNYHEPSIVYTVIRSGEWVGVPVKAIQNDSLGNE